MTGLGGLLLLVWFDFGMLAALLVYNKPFEGDKGPGL